MTACIHDLRGLWRRTILRLNDDLLDSSTEVFWLQGPYFFADIRQPINRPSFADVHCLRDLTVDHLAWLTLQEGFAGQLYLSGADAWWQRGIDFQPQSQFADRARLRQTGDILDEYGTEHPYYEQWERQHRPLAPCWGTRLERLSDGRSGYLVRVAGKMMFGRARSAPLPPVRSLTEALQELPTIDEKLALMDFEISLGSLRGDDGHAWWIERSTLPFKEGKRWPIRLLPGTPENPAKLIEIVDLDSEGKPVVCRWRIMDADNPVAAQEFRGALPAETAAAQRGSNGGPT